MITIDEILKQCGQLKVEEERVHSIDYDEWIIFADEIDQWSKVLTGALGPVVKPADQKTTPRHFSLTVNYGGLFDDQTLFYKRFDERSIIAMFWPWKNKIHVTFKIACFQE
jgi:hypothetical protein